MIKILKLLAVVAALVPGWPLGVLLVQLLCTTPLFGYCGGHDHAGAVFLSFWAIGSVLPWLGLRSALNHWLGDRLPVIRSEDGE